MWVRDYGEEKTKCILEGFYKERATTIRINGNATTKEELIRELTGEGIQVKEHPLLASALLISGYMIIWQQSRRSGKEKSGTGCSFDHGSGTGRNQRRRLHTGCVRGTGEKSAPCGTDPEWDRYGRGKGSIEMKVELIRENISRMGFENIRAVQQDATCFDADSEEKADVLIADLPCSGLGVPCEEDRSEV